MRSFLIFPFVVVVCCGVEVDGYQVDGGRPAAGDTDTDTDTGSSSATDTDTDTGSSSATDTGTAGDTDTGTAGDTDTDTGTGAPCGGVEVAGACWYLGDQGAPCGVVCAGRGGYSEATRTIAGSDGTDQQCAAVLVALGAGSLFLPGLVEPEPVGCCALASTGPHKLTRVSSPPTTRDGAAVYKLRACACNY